MKSILEQIALFNVWANDKLIHAILELDPSYHTRVVKSSFPSLLETVMHMLYAETAWWQRLNREDIKQNKPAAAAPVSMKEAAQALFQMDRLWEQWVARSTDDSLAGVLAYRSSKGEPFEQPVYQVAYHVFNHGTYHRGQLVTMLRALDIGKIPQTDFIVWTRFAGK